MKTSITSFPVNPTDLLTALKKAEILSPAIVAMPEDIPWLNAHLRKTIGKELCLRADKKAYVLKNWGGKSALLSTLEQYAQSSSSSIRISIS